MVKNVLAVIFIFALMFCGQLWLNAIRLEEKFFYIERYLAILMSWIVDCVSLAKKEKEKTHNSFFAILGLLKKLLCLFFLQGWVESKFQRSCFAHFLWNFGPKLYKVITFCTLGYLGYFIRSMKLFLIHIRVVFIYMHISAKV